MGAMASQITGLTNGYSSVYSRHRSKKTSKLRVTGLYEGNSPVTGEFPAQMASSAESVSIGWRHHAVILCSIASGWWILITVPRNDTKPDNVTLSRQGSIFPWQESRANATHRLTLFILVAFFFILSEITHFHHDYFTSSEANIHFSYFQISNSDA